MILGLIILQIGFVVVLIYLFRKLMIKSLTKATVHLEELNRDYAKKEEEINKLLEEAKQKKELIIQEAQIKAEEIKNNTLNEAKEKKEKIIEEARNEAISIIKEAEKAREKLILELEERISKEAFNKAYQLLKDVLPKNFKEAIHNKWIEELLSQEFIYFENINIPSDLNTVKIISAFKLNDNIRETLRKKIEQKLNRNLTVLEEINEDLISGIIINLGNLIIDASLKNKILKIKT